MTANGEAAASLGADANLLMIIQVPLKYRRRPRATAGVDESATRRWPSPRRRRSQRRRHEARRARRVRRRDRGARPRPELGPYTELDGLTIERDPRFPVRVTVQFYQATSNGVRRRGRRAQPGARRSRRSTRGRLRRLAGRPRRRPPAPDQLGRRHDPPARRHDQDFPGLMQRRQDAAFIKPR